MVGSSREVVTILTRCLWSVNDKVKALVYIGVRDLQLTAMLINMLNHGGAFIFLLVNWYDVKIYQCMYFPSLECDPFVSKVPSPHFSRSR